MALINCPECGREISDSSEKCIHCGYTLHPERQAKSKKKKIVVVVLVAAVAVIAVLAGIMLMEQKDAAVFEHSKAAYLKLNETAEICEQAMSDIYNAWMWGIYDWDDKKTASELSSSLQKEVSVDLESGADLLYEDSTAGTYLILSALMNDSDWQGCVELVIASYENTGVYAQADTLLAEAQSALKVVSEKNADYQYYPMLKQYYAKISAMLEFVKSPSGSFEQLKTTKNDYMNSIDSYQGDLSFVFAE